MREAAIFCHRGRCGAATWDAANGRSSLGGVESLITHPATITYYGCTREERLALGIKDGLIRLAVGVEDAQDIVHDIDQALC